MIVGSAAAGGVAGSLFAINPNNAWKEVSKENLPASAGAAAQVTSILPSVKAAPPCIV